MPKMQEFPKGAPSTGFSEAEDIGGEAFELVLDRASAKCNRFSQSNANY
jgi:hypothetical protein